jgi:hypothetical protein
MSRLSRIWGWKDFLQGEVPIKVCDAFGLLFVLQDFLRAESGCHFDKLQKIFIKLNSNQKRKLNRNFVQQILLVVRKGHRKTKVQSNFQRNSSSMSVLKIPLKIYDLCPFYKVL